LQVIGQVLKVAGGLEMAVGVIGVVLVPLVLSGADGALVELGLPITSPGTGLIIGIVGGILTLFTGVVAGLLTYALGELINVAIDIEENTRIAAGENHLLA
jgi:hypothetical protein